MAYIQSLNRIRRWIWTLEIKNNNNFKAFKLFWSRVQIVTKRSKLYSARVFLSVHSYMINDFNITNKIELVHISRWQILQTLTTLMLYVCFSCCLSFLDRYSPALPPLQPSALPLRWLTAVHKQKIISHPMSIWPILLQQLKNPRGLKLKILPHQGLVWALYIEQQQGQNRLCGAPVLPQHQDQKK